VKKCKNCGVAIFYFLLHRISETTTMLSKRTNSYEIQKPISPSKVPVRSTNKGTNKQVTSNSTSTSSQYSNSNNSSGAVHSNSFNFSQSRSSVTSVPSSISSRAVQPPVRRSLRNTSATTNGNTKQPKMGVPMMTSTPARSLKTADYISSSAGPSIDEEPIYCEIPSPNKRPLPPPPLSSNRSSGLRASLRSNGLSSSVMPPLQQQQPQKASNNAAPTRMLKTNGAITSGLGRRAITQLDMSAASRLSAAISSSRPVTARQPSIPSAKWLPGEHFQFPNPTSSNYPGGSEVEMLLNTADPLSSSSTNNSNGSSTTSLLKGVLWQQREKRFSRWKERFFILTNDYLQCFRRGSSKLSEMGSFIFRIRLCEIEEVDLVERRGYLTLRILVKNEPGRLLLRKTDGIRKWYQLIQETIDSSKQRRVSMKSSEQFWKRQHTDSSAMENWVLARQRVGQQYCWSDTASCISETASTTILPNHLTSAAGGNLGGGNLGGNLGGKSGNGRPTSNLETASAVALGRKSYNNLRTTHYGLIDWPSPKAVLATSNGKSTLTTSPRCLPNQGKLLQKESMVNQSHDSGVDSMNTNSSGSMMSSSECSSSRQKSPTSILLDSEKFSRQITLV